MVTANSSKTTAVVVVAHPDDETLWAGGTILNHPRWRWYIIALCRADDADRAPKFRKALNALKADGAMGKLDDSAEQSPLDVEVVQKEVLSHLPQRNFDLIITHDPKGEYTRHRRHEETCMGVCTLLKDGVISARHLWAFAYEDGGKRYLPRARENVDFLYRLPRDIWVRKYEIITDVYGFSKTSFEARTTPRKEAFRCFNSLVEIEKLFLERREK
jgi:LmbE family N-acetylglucosaminyl deacetylase